MFRSALLALESPINSSAALLQLVRWRRKPRWLPVAKSKLFRVPERKVQDQIEREELMRLHANYKTQLRAVRGYLMTESEAREATSTADHFIISPEMEEEDFRKCAEMNEQWNAEIALIRNERLRQEKTAERELILQRLDSKKERVAQRRTAAEERVLMEKERAKTLITPENIDQAIEEALANTVDYNFAIDLEERIHRSDRK